MRNYWQKWQRFWFLPTDLFRLALFRWIFSFFLFIMYVVRLTEFKIFFSEEGLFTHGSATSYLPDFLKPSIYLFSASDSLNLFFYVVLLALIFLLFLGLANRSVTFVILILHLMFLERNPAIMYGADLVSTFWLFYLCFIKHDAYFTVRNFLPKLKYKMPVSDIFTATGFRFIQIQLCIIYAYTGMEKLKGHTWWDGSAVWYVMGNDNIVSLNLSFFHHIPWAVAIMTFSTLIFEIYFPFAIWNKALKPIWMFLGVCLHGLAAIFMGLTFFSPIMLSSYVLFLEPEQLRRFFKRLKLPPQFLKFVNL